MKVRSLGPPRKAVFTSEWRLISDTLGQETVRFTDGWLRRKYPYDKHQAMLHEPMSFRSAAIAHVMHRIARAVPADGNEAAFLAINLIRTMGEPASSTSILDLAKGKTKAAASPRGLSALVFYDAGRAWTWADLSTE